MALIDPLVIKWLIDTILPEKKMLLVPIAALVFLIAYFTRLFLNNLAAVLNFRATQHILLRVRLLILRHLLMLSAEFYDRNQVGNISFRVDDDVDKLREVGGDFVLTFSRTTVVSVFILGAMLAINPWLTCVIVPLIPVYLLVRRRYNSHLNRWSVIVQETASRSAAFLFECLSSIVQVQVLRRESAQLQGFLRLGREALKAQLARRKTEAFYGSFSSASVALGLALVLGFGGYAVVRDMLTIGALFAFYTYLNRLFEPIAGVVDLHTRVPQLKVSIGRLMELLATRPGVVEHENPVELRNLSALPILFSNVSFGYGQREVLKDFNFKISPKTKLAVVGSSGSGKSTMAKLLLRLYDIDSGRIVVGGHDLRSLRLKGLRREMSLILQEPVLFNGTLNENLLLGNPQASREEIENVIQFAGLSNLLSRLPNGLNEYIGPRGAMLSGGEKQRVALARAFLRQSGMIILDESTSALDRPTEASILATLDKQCSDRTIVFISHRSSVMLWADEILLVDRGQAVAVGTHEQLYGSSHLYRKIFNEQTESEAGFAGSTAAAMECAS